MTNSGSKTETRLKYLAIAYLLVATFVSHFFLWKDFGLYEDDYVFISQPMAESGWGNVLSKVATYFSTWPQGRPLGFSIPAVVSYLGQQAGGLQSIYLFGFTVNALNVCLTFLILRKFAPLPAAVIGAMLFSLYPADTSKILLTHSLWLQVAWTCTLSAALAYLNGRTVLFYCLAFLPLIIYESVILPLFAIPLLRAEFTKAFVREYSRHVLGLILLIAIYMTIRYFFFQESRILGALQMDRLHLAETVLSSIFVGPLLSASTFLIRPVTIFTDATWSTWFFIAGYFLLTLFCLSVTVRGGNNAASQNGEVVAREMTVPGISINIRFQSALAPTYRLILTGLVMWPISYHLAFTHWPRYSLAGRTVSSMHLAATLAAPLLVAGMLSLLYGNKTRLDGKARSRSILCIVLSIYLSLLAGFHFLVQQDYAESWSRQKRFWSEVISLTSDINDKSVVLVPDESLQDTKAKYIYTRSWGNLITYYQVYRFGNPWITETPRVVFLDRETVNSFKIVDGELYWSAPRFNARQGRIVNDSEKVDRENLILLIMKDGRLERYSGWAKFGKVRVLIPAPRAASRYPKMPLYELIMKAG